MIRRVIHKIGRQIFARYEGFSGVTTLVCEKSKWSCHGKVRIISKISKSRTNLKRKCKRSNCLKWWLWTNCHLPWSYAAKSGVFSLQFSDCKLESSNAAIIWRSCESSFGHIFLSLISVLISVVSRYMKIVLWWFLFSQELIVIRFCWWESLYEKTRRGAGGARGPPGAQVRRRLFEMAIEND